MKVTKAQLKKIIKEELEAVLNEDDFADVSAAATAEFDCGKLGRELQNARKNAKSIGDHGDPRAAQEEEKAYWAHVSVQQKAFDTKCKGIKSASNVTIPT